MIFFCRYSDFLINKIIYIIILIIHIIFISLIFYFFIILIKANIFNQYIFKNKM